jgi:hypothetical protein
MWSESDLSQSANARITYKVKEKLSLCLIWHHTVKVCEGVELLQTFLSSALDRAVCTALNSCPLYHWEKEPVPTE